MPREILTRRNLGIKFYRARIAKGISQSQLAKLAGVSPTTLRNIELGHTKRPQPYIISRIAKTLDLEY